MRTKRPYGPLLSTSAAVALCLSKSSRIKRGFLRKFQTILCLGAQQGSFPIDADHPKGKLLGSHKIDEADQMTEISIRMAEDDDDYEVARGLCREWLEWHWNAYPEDWPVEGNPMDPEKFEVTLNDLPNLHARPRGQS